MFSDIIKSFFAEDGRLGFILDFFSNDKNGMSFNEDGSVVVTTDVDMSDDEYQKYVNGVLEIFKDMVKLSGIDSFIVMITAGNREKVTYVYNKEDNDFRILTDDKKVKDGDVCCITESDVEVKDRASGVKSSVVDNTVDDNDSTKSFAKILHERIDNMIAERNASNKENIFSVDYAIEKMNSIFDEGTYDLTYDENDNVIGIDVSAENLVEDFDGCSDDAENILNDGNNVYKFVNRCISELGFTNVIPSFKEITDEYSTVNFRFIF